VASVNHHTLLGTTPSESKRRKY